MALEDCYEAFDRLKAGKGTKDGCIGLAQESITPARVSVEAGHDAGYLKKKREQHSGIISAIHNYKNNSTSTTLSKAETKRRSDERLGKVGAELKLTKQRLEDSLARELKLVTRLRELEEDMHKQPNVVRFNV
jgi:hypothetical protein